MNKFLFFLKSIWQGKTLLRSSMNWELKNYSVEGKVLDIGGGESPSYFKYLGTKDANIVNLDMEKGSNALRVDLEKDLFPFQDNSIDNILAFNILEHIFDYNHVLSESKRALKSRGRFLGFVPFLINYHPDPHDYFRYTKEALEKIFSKNSFKTIEIKEIGGGPLRVNFNNLAPSLPRFLRVLILPIYLILDSIFLKIRPKAKERFPLGFLFLFEKF